MRILYINSLYAPHVGGGAEVMIKSLVEGVQKRGHEVAVLTTCADKGLRKEEYDGVKVWRAGIENIYWQQNKYRSNNISRIIWHYKDSYNAKMRSYIKCVINEEKPDIVNCHNLAGWSISAWDEIKNSKLPIVQTLHDYYLLCPKSTMFNNGKPCEKQCLVCSIFRLKHKQNSKKVDVVVGVSDYVINRICAGGLFENVKTQIVYNASSVLDTGIVLSGDTRELRFGYIGTLSETKGIEWLIRQFKKHNIKGTLKVAGKGDDSYTAHLKTLANSDRIEFMGYMSSTQFYSQIDVCIVPSLWAEPFGMVTIEANAYHLPVISSGKGGQSEIVYHEKNGLIVDPDDPDSLGKAMLRIENNEQLYRSMVNSARKAVSKYLDVDRMIKSYEDIYNECSG